MFNSVSRQGDAWPLLQPAVGPSHHSEIESVDDAVPIAVTARIGGDFDGHEPVVCPAANCHVEAVNNAIMIDVTPWALGR
jgi:hypothetical protein